LALSSAFGKQGRTVSYNFHATPYPLLLKLEDMNDKDCSPLVAKNYEAGDFSYTAWKQASYDDDYKIHPESIVSRH